MIISTGPGAWFHPSRRRGEGRREVKVLVAAPRRLPAVIIGQMSIKTALDQVQKGMRCTGLSVIKGTEISSFDVEILDVIAPEAGGEFSATCDLRFLGREHVLQSIEMLDARQQGLFGGRDGRQHQHHAFAHRVLEQRGCFDAERHARAKSLREPSFGARVPCAHDRQFVEKGPRRRELSDGP